MTIDILLESACRRHSVGPVYCLLIEMPVSKQQQQQQQQQQKQKQKADNKFLRPALKRNMFDFSHVPKLISG